MTRASPLSDPDRRRPLGRAGSPAGRPRRARRVGSGLILMGSAALLAAGLFFGGFLGFVDRVVALSDPGTAVADGIVALTGGTDRVAGAIELLREKRARRLLISGVHPDTSARQISRVVDASTALFDCCVDLDRRAANTLGNATETAKWVRANAFSSLIVVTSAYHMPRALAELGSAMPGVRLIAYPVAPGRLGLDRWWTRPETIGLLLEEYLKYTASRARLGLDEMSAATAVPVGAAR